MNKTILIGRLTKDPELKQTANGVSVSTFTLAVNRDFKNQDGEYDADFINCVAWKNTAENLVKYQSKGNQIAVFGRLQTRTYEDNDGKTVYVTETVCENIQFLQNENKTKKDEGGYGKTAKQVFDFDDDNLPF